MKRVQGFLIALLLVAFAATPAFAEGPDRGDVFCTGGSTLVKADETPENVLLFGCGARIQSGARVSRDVVSFGGDLVLEEGARVERDVVIFGGNTRVAGRIGRGITLFGGTVTLEPTAVVERDVTVFGGRIEKKEGAVVRGRLTRGEGFGFGRFRLAPLAPIVMPTAIGGGVLGAMVGLAFGFMRSLVTALALAALGALTVVFLPTQTKQVSDVAEKSALPSLGVGCLTLLVAPTLLLLLVIIIVGIPIALLLILALVVAWLFGWIALGRLIGEKTLEAFKVREILPIVAVIVGVIVLTVVGAVPLIGWLISLAVGLLGTGAVVLTRFGTRAYPTLAPAPVAVAPVVPSAPAPVEPAAPSAPASPGNSDAAS